MKSSRLFISIIVLVAVSVVLIGCTGQSPTPETAMSPPESGIETPPTSEVEPSPPGEDWVWSEAAGRYIREEDGTYLWLGFHHEWTSEARRFRDLNCYYENIEHIFNPTAGTSRLTGKVVGQQTHPLGFIADSLKYYTVGKAIKTAVAEFRYGSETVSVKTPVGERYWVSVPMAIPLGDLEKYDNVTIFMRGFSFDETADIELAGAHAYPIQNFGLWATDIQRLGSVLKYNLNLFLKTAPKPGNLNPKPDPCEYTITYFYTMVGGNSDEFSFTHSDKDYRMGWDYDVKDCLPPPPWQLTIKGEPSYNRGVVVLRGFFIEINDGDSGLSGKNSEYRGRLLRTVEVKITDQVYKSERGEISFTPEFFVCNTTQIGQLPMNADYRGFFTLLQFQDADQWGEVATFQDAGKGVKEGMVRKDSNYEYYDDLKTISFPTPW